MSHLPLLPGHLRKDNQSIVHFQTLPVYWFCIRLCGQCEQNIKNFPAYFKSAQMWAFESVILGKIMGQVNA